MDDLYREQIIERYKNPLHKGVLDPHDISYQDDNPLCGDQIRIDLRVGPDDVVTEAAFSGHGCSISLASADLLVEKCVPALPDELRETAFAHACDLVLADGVVEDEERALVEKLQKKLEIPGDQAMDIVRVMVIKNRG